MLLHELALLLETEGIGTRGVDLFYGQMPETPDDCVALFEYSGGDPGYSKSGRSSFERPRFQVIVRSPSYDNARTKAEDIYRILSGFKGEINGVRYFMITALQSPFADPGGRDDNGRARILCNYEAFKQLS